MVVAAAVGDVADAVRMLAAAGLTPELAVVGAVAADVLADGVGEADVDGDAEDDGEAVVGVGLDCAVQV